jgi:hypothetical protein
MSATDIQAHGNETAGLVTMGAKRDTLVLPRAM